MVTKQKPDVFFYKTEFKKKKLILKKRNVDKLFPPLTSRKQCVITKAKKKTL